MTTVCKFLVADVVGESIKVVGNICRHGAVIAEALVAQVRLRAMMSVMWYGGCFELKKGVREEKPGGAIAWKIEDRTYARAQVGLDISRSTAEVRAIGSLALTPLICRS